jgi:hypothetical protein
MARMEALRQYTNWARVTRERISRELAEPRGTDDLRILYELNILATSSVVGIDRLISEETDIERIESEAPEEIELEHALWDELQELAEVVNAVEAELQRADDSEEEGVTSPTAQKVQERWFSHEKAS